MTVHPVAPHTLSVKGRVLIPGLYKLPLRVDMKVRLDYPLFILLAGRGHVSFASSPQDNRKIEDIFFPDGKPNKDKGEYDNSIPFNKWTDISVIYCLDGMQILINGAERFFSRTLPYMKKKNRAVSDAEAVDLRLVVSKGSLLEVKNIRVTELDGGVEIERAEPPANKVKTVAQILKPTYETVTANLPPEFKKELDGTDAFLKSLKQLRIKRAVDKNGGKITYLSSVYGVSYIFHIEGAWFYHEFGWYIITAGKPETWHRKDNRMEEVLSAIRESQSDLAARIFYSLNDCVNCSGQRCLSKTLYAFNGQKRMTCHGRVKLRMCREDFRDAREFFKVLNGFPPPLIT